MSILLRRRRHSPRPLFASSAVAALCLFVGALVVSELRGPGVETRYAKLAVGDVRILEERIPVRGVTSSAPTVALAELSRASGLIVRGLRGGHSEIAFQRADGKRFLYNIAVKDPLQKRLPINLVRLPPRQQPAPNLVRRPPRPSDEQKRREARRELEKKKKLEELREVKPNGQVVEIEPPAVARRPKDARFLSEFDSTVKEETQARTKGLRRGRAGPAAAARPAPVSRPTPPPPHPAVAARPPTPPTVAAPAPEKAAVQATTPAKAVEIPKTAKLPESPTPGTPTLPPPLPGTPPAPRAATQPALASKSPDGQLPPAPSSAQAKPDEPTKLASLPAPPGGAPEPSAVPGLEPDEPSPPPGLPPGHHIELAPSPQVLHQALGGGEGGGAGFPDKLGGIKEGDGTFLNTKEWKGASFFNRMKAQVAQKWSPAEVYARRDPTGQRYGIKDRYTLVHVTLNGDGSLRNLRILSPSGVDFLDEEAMGALEGAQPFPNPPPEVKDKDGLIRFSFGFYFEVSDRPMFRIFK